MNQESFADLLEASMPSDIAYEGSVLRGTVLNIENDIAIIDVKLKSDGRVPLKEFTTPEGNIELAIGDQVDVFVERMADHNGEVLLSRDKAKREEAWQRLEDAFNKDQRISGVIYGRVKGGFTVNLSGATAFLPGSQIDIHPTRDATPFMHSPQTFRILKLDRARGNIVVSRRAVLEESRAEECSRLVTTLKEGQVLQGVVKNITDYGAFIDLGGVDGLLHVTDISWYRIRHPSDVLSVGQTIDVQVIRFNPETKRISLGMKQFEPDPWEAVAKKYPPGTKLIGKVTNITEYGAFVEIEPGVEGLVHVSEMSWIKKNIHPGKIVSSSQQIEVMVLDIDLSRRRGSLGIKQCLPNPWEGFKQSHPIGSEIEGEIRNITEFGLFIAMPGDIDGMVHISDLDWRISGEEAIKNYQKGQTVRTNILDIDIEKERIALGIKQLKPDPMDSGRLTFKNGDTVTCTISAIQAGGIEVTVGEGLPGFIRKSELARDRFEQRSDRFAVGEKVDAKIIAIDKASKRLSLSIKQLEIQEENQAMANFGTADSGATLGDILGSNFKSRITRAAEADQESQETSPDEHPSPDKVDSQ